jgi:hypothetical protein
VNGRAGAATAALTKHSKETSAFGKKEAKSIEAMAGKELNKFKEMAQGATEARVAVHDALKEELASDLKAFQTQEELVEGGAAELAAFATDQVDLMKYLANEVRTAVDERYAVDEGREDVPPAASRERPARVHAEVDALRAPPTELLQAQFRARHGMDEFVANPVNIIEEMEAEDGLERCRIEAETENAAPAAVMPEAAAAASVGDAQPLSPSLVGQKRGRSSGDDGGSPSKLRAAFKRGERRRGGRHVVE